MGIPPKKNHLKAFLIFCSTTKTKKPPKNLILIKWVKENIHPYYDVYIISGNVSILTVKKTTQKRVNSPGLKSNY